MTNVVEEIREELHEARKQGRSVDTVRLSGEKLAELRDSESLITTEEYN